MVFPVVMEYENSHGYENWNIKKAEHRRTDVFKLWCLRRLLRVPWTARRSSQLILKEINPEYSLNRLILKLKFHILATSCEEPTHLKGPWCWESLKAGGEGGDRRWGGWIVSQAQWTQVWANSGWKRRTGKPSLRQSVGWQRVYQRKFNYVNQDHWPEFSSTKTLCITVILSIGKEPPLRNSTYMSGRIYIFLSCLSGWWGLGVARRLLTVCTNSESS